MITRITRIVKVDRERGSLVVADRARFVEQLKAFRDGQAEIIIQTVAPFRSRPQLAYYWTVVIKACTHGFNNVGYDYDDNDTHADLKRRFLYIEEPDELTGEPVRRYLSLSDSAQEVDTRMMNDYIEKIKQFATEHLGIYIPDPNEAYVQED